MLCHIPENKTYGSSISSYKKFESQVLLKLPETASIPDSSQIASKAIPSTIAVETLMYLLYKYVMFYYRLGSLI
jgi:hypothetical protein